MTGVPAGRILEFSLMAPTPTLNELLRLKHWQRLERKLALSTEIRIALGQSLPAAPFARAHVRIERYSRGTPDEDGLIGGCKDLIDVLLPQGELRQQRRKATVAVPGHKNPVLVEKVRYHVPHPGGLGIISDDRPSCLTRDVIAIRVNRAGDQRTTVRITELV